MRVGLIVRKSNVMWKKKKQGSFGGDSVHRVSSVLVWSKDKAYCLPANVYSKEWNVDLTGAWGLLKTGGLPTQTTPMWGGGLPERPHEINKHTRCLEEQNHLQRWPDQPASRVDKPSMATHMLPGRNYYLALVHRPKRLLTRVKDAVRPAAGRRDNWRMGTGAGETIKTFLNRISTRY